MGLETNCIKQLERKLVQIRAALPTLPIDAWLSQGMTLHHPVTVAILVTNAIVKITSHFLQ